MIEVEIKIPIQNAEVVSEKLAALAFSPGETILEEDTYYDNAAGQIRRSDQALRIRKVVDRDSELERCLVTFKDRKLDAVSVTRPEYETEISDAASFARILAGCGFAPVQPQVRKLRRTCTKGNVTACLDEVEGLGTFLELETVIPESESRESALEWLACLLQQLGLDMAETTRTSYLSQLQDRLQRLSG